MARIDLILFSLEHYDHDNEKHKELAAIFEGDPFDKNNEFLNYAEAFWSLDDSVKYDRKQGKYAGAYFAYIGEILVGMIALIWINDYPELIVSILPEHRGNHYSKHLLQEYTDYVFENYQEYSEIYATIQPENTHSVENTLAAGFKQLDEYKYVKRR